VLEATYGMEQEVVHQIQLSVTEGITGFCFRTGKTVNTADARRHPEYCASPVRGPQLQGTAGRAADGQRPRHRCDGLRQQGGQGVSRKMVDMAQAIASPLAVFLLNARLSQSLSGPPKHPEKKLVRHVVKGNPITEGVVHGYAQFLAGAELLDALAPEYTQDLEAERTLLQRALVIARGETSQIQKEAAKLWPKQTPHFYAHMLLLEDPTLSQRLQQALARGFTLRFALKLVAEEFSKEMRSTANALLRERVVDMKDVILRLYQAAERLTGNARSRRPAGQPARRPGHAAGQADHRGARAAAVATDPPPALPARGHPLRGGGATTHVAILAGRCGCP